MFTELTTSSRNVVESGPVNVYTSPHLEKPVASRKRKINIDGRKQTIRKRKRQHGEKYISSNGKEIGAKYIKPPCSSKCYLNCSTNFTESQRRNIFEAFWSLDDAQKSSFYNKFVERKPVQRRRIAESQKKSYSFSYYFERDNLKVRVCKVFFLNTIDISDFRIYYCFKNLNDEETGVSQEIKQGKHTKHCLAEELKNKVRSHITSFPAVDSHYCRATTSKKYLEEGLSVRKIYTLFEEKHPDAKVSLTTFTKIFDTEFNISFHKPKKDQCDRCSLYKKQSKDGQLSDCEKKIFEMHTTEKNFCKIERDKDRMSVSNNTIVVCFDLQSTFNLPKGFSSVFYYKRKLSVYNMTATVCTQNTNDRITYCAVWSEGLCGRSGNDIASAVMRILESILQDFSNTEHIILWSDSCVPQNKNKILSSALLRVMYERHNIKTIIQKFSEPGHSQIQEIDAVHSTIDRFLKLKQIHSPLHLISYLENYRSKKVKLKIIKMLPHDFKMYSVLANKLSFDCVPFTKIKSIKYDKNDLFALQYKTSLSKNKYHSTCLRKTARKGFLQTPNNLFQIELDTSARNKISSEKIKDIESLYIYLPEEDVQYFSNLLSR